MPKTKLNEEGAVKKVINAVFSAVANRKMQALQKAMMKDPKFRESVAKLEQARDDLEKHFEEVNKKDPNYKKFSDTYDRYRKDILGR